MSASRVSLSESTLALGSLDGRYRSAVAGLIDHLSEAALNRNRVHVEVEWFIYLCENSVLPGLNPLTDEQKTGLRAIVTEFNTDSVAELAEIEAVTVHDVKAVEYYIGRRLEALGLENLKALVHFACTSEDINNLSYALGIRDAIQDVWLPAAWDLVNQLSEMAEADRKTPMLSRTHGQPATPSTLGKEIAVFAYRLARQLRRIQNTEYLGKINGATGTYAAHLAAAPAVDWQSISRGFVESLGLSWNPLTTQIENHDWQAELYSDIARFNQILHNLCTDIWSYISIRFFQQIPVEGATGSSTMPHKINPIRFENAEANLEISNGLLNTLASTLVQSRWQRDLTDSSSQRNIGTAVGHSLLAISNVSKGLERLDTAVDVIAADLDENWEVLGEAVQTVMRAEAIAGVEGMDNPYERLKDLTRGHRVDGERMREFVKGLGLSADAEERLLNLTPQTYTGIADQLVDWVSQRS
ncbi:adenylosuccinate lyase [Pseudoglutamicibacter albus]|uniref:adenylosuccinate lyase n=1 Tax=Pseudoglutamicibacter TaxID=1742991 RepID=UPI000C794C16|nr:MULTISPECIES: adenylosuccinate lyase [Pseudoglutamicibacter]MDZ3744902.1 adenylosuccinate lyase [Pseudoglutamicibacter cumminsii]PKY79698.1 adenylosuccinate lyase [Pseudoglutamicibacter albus]WIK83635.1 adenylosuccinate lyase [Pseudoglutamicibacter albus]